MTSVVCFLLLLLLVLLRPLLRGFLLLLLFLPLLFPGGSTAEHVLPFENETVAFTNYSAMRDTKLGDMFVFNTTSETWHPVALALASQARDR